MYQFEQLEELGCGAFGTVTKCRNKETGEIVAIKRLNQSFSSLDECCRLNEVKSLRKIKHDNVVRLIQFFRENGHLYLVFELLHGSLYKSISNSSAPFTEPQVRGIVKQILQGLAFVHKQGFFHRDIKPENLLWGKGGLKIADFGISREVKSKPPYTEYVSTRWYRAPEIILRSPFYNKPVDIWAAGCIMAEMFLLKPIFMGSSENDQLFKICSVLGTPSKENWPEGEKLAEKLQIRLPRFAKVPLASIIPNVSKEALELLQKMLTFDPKKRPTAEELLKDPWFEGPIEALAVEKEKEKPKEAERVTDERRLKDDESIQINVTDLSQKNVLKRRTLMDSDSDSSSSSFNSDFDDL